MEIACNQDFVTCTASIQELNQSGITLDDFLQKTDKALVFISTLRDKISEISGIPVECFSSVLATPVANGLMIKYFIITNNENSSVDNTSSVSHVCIAGFASLIIAADFCQAVNMPAGKYPSSLMKSPDGIFVVIIDTDDETFHEKFMLCSAEFLAITALPSVSYMEEHFTPIIRSEAVEKLSFLSEY